jgi:serine/threonine protein kinase
METNKSDLSADALLNKYADSKTAILKNLSENYKSLELWNGKDLKIDRECQCKMGYYDSHLTLKSQTCCAQCSEMSLLTDLTDNQVGTPFKIQYGKNIDRLLVIEIDRNVIPKIQYSPHIKSNLEYLFQYFTSFKACDSTLSLDTQWLALDSFSNKVINTMILETVIPKNIPNIHTAFICGNDGYTLLDEPEIGFFEALFEFPEFFNYKSLKPEIVRSILRQICEILLKLKPYDFCHNNATINSLRFQLEGDDLIIQIAGLEHSALNYGNLRIYHSNPFSKLFVKNEPFIPDIKIVDSGVCGSGSTYKFNTESGKQIINLRKLGIPIYNTSFDLYAFLISLCAQTEFYNTLISDQQLSIVWKKIWIGMDLNVITYKLSEIHKDSIFDLKMEKITEILSSLTLRCDFLNFLINLLK